MDTPVQRIIEFKSIDSTNAEAHRRAVDGERGPLWIRADQQLAGRGRSGRAWSSPPGNFSATFMFEPGVGPAQLHQLSFVAGVAVFDAIRSTFDVLPSLLLKWPNDVLIGDAKTAGILVESTRYDGTNVVLIGIGINIASAPGIPGRAVTTLADHGSRISPAVLLHRIADEMSANLEIWSRAAGFSRILELWLARAHPLGEPLRVHQGDTYIAGIFAGLDPDGALRLRLDTGELVRVEHGDVSLERLPHALKGTS